MGQAVCRLITRMRKCTDAGEVNSKEGAVLAGVAATWGSCPGTPDLVPVGALRMTWKRVCTVHSATGLVS